MVHGILILVREDDRLCAIAGTNYLFDGDYCDVSSDKLFDWMQLASGLVVPKPEFMAVPRSGSWPTVRGKHLKLHPLCAACGGDRELNVHHKKPFHEHPELELDESNIIALCNKHGCHLLIGHLCSWHSYNPRVEEDAAAYLERVKNRP